MTRAPVRALVATILAAAALAVPSPAGAATVSYPSGTCGGTLQACINKVANGSTILIAKNQRIDENLTITKALTLRRKPGFQPVIGGDDSTQANLRTILVSDEGSSVPRVVIDGIKFTHANVDVTFFESGGTFTLKNSSILNQIDHSNVDGVYLASEGSNRFEVINNTIRTTGDGVEMYAGPAAGQETKLLVARNRMFGVEEPNESANGVELDLRDAGKVTVGVHNNLIHNFGGCSCGGPAGIGVSPGDSSKVTARIIGNTIDTMQATADGIVLGAGGASTLAAYVFNNSVSNIGGRGFSVSNTPGVTLFNGYNNFYNGGDPNIYGPSEEGPGTTIHNPAYLNPSDDKFQLKPGSPLGDSGSACTVGGLYMKDAAGKARVAGAEVDMGAFETGSYKQAIGSYRLGTKKGNTLNGTKGRDVLCGMGGPDALYGKGGGDFLYGGPGNDLHEGGDGADYAEGDDGEDRHNGGEGADNLDATDGVAGNDKVNGGPGTDDCRTDPGDEQKSC